MIANSTNPLESATNGVGWGQERLPNFSDATSTLDANGVPKKKRKRKYGALAAGQAMSPPAPSSPVRPTVPGRRDNEKVTKDGDSSSQRAPLTIPPSSPRRLESPALEASALPKGAKRKRQDTSETQAVVSSRPVSSTALPSSPPSRRPSLPSPAKKKRRKDKSTQEPTAVTSAHTGVTEAHKESGSTTENVTSAFSQTAAVAVSAGAASPNAEDPVEAGKAARKTKKEGKEKKRLILEAENTPAPPKESAKRSKKPMNEDTSDARGPVTTPGMSSFILIDDLANLRGCVVVSSPSRTPPADVQPST